MLTGKKFSKLSQIINIKRHKKCFMITTDESNFLLIFWSILQNIWWCNTDNKYNGNSIVIKSFIDKLTLSFSFLCLLWACASLSLRRCLPGDMIVLMWWCSWWSCILITSGLGFRYGDTLSGGEKLRSRGRSNGERSKCTEWPCHNNLQLLLI